MYYITTTLYEGWETARKQWYSQLPALFNILDLCHPFFHFAYSLKCATITSAGKKIIILESDPLLQLLRLCTLPLSLRQGTRKASQGHGVRNTPLLTEQAGWSRECCLSYRQSPAPVLCGPPTRPRIRLLPLSLPLAGSVPGTLASLLFLGHGEQTPLLSQTQGLCPCCFLCAGPCSFWHYLCLLPCLPQLSAAKAAPQEGPSWPLV